VRGDTGEVDGQKGARLWRAFCLTPHARAGERALWPEARFNLALQQVITIDEDGEDAPSSPPPATPEVAGALFDADDMPPCLEEFESLARAARERGRAEPDVSNLNYPENGYLHSSSPPPGYQVQQDVAVVCASSLDVLIFLRLRAGLHRAR
jgi:hypothetical protein